MKSELIIFYFIKFIYKIIWVIIVNLGGYNYFDIYKLINL